jgi:protein-glutamine gamma-glutamyltransferase
MSSSVIPPTGVSPLPAERFFRGALLFLILTSIATLIATGKLDAITCVLASVAILYKAFRWWLGQPPELSHRTATWLVAGYMGFFPLDVLFFSRTFVVTSTNPSLYAALLSAVHFLLFVMLVRLFSATSDRDALFLAMLSFAAILAAAVLTVDTSFLFLFFLFLLFGIATFVGMEMRRGANGAIVPPAAQAAQAHRLDRALALAVVSVALGAIVMGSTLFFFFPRFRAGYLGHTGMQPSLMTGFTDDVELGQIGEIKKNSAVVMRVKTGKPVGYAMLRWRGIALSTFDGKRWSAPDHRATVVAADPSGWIYVADPQQARDGAGTALNYEVLLEPVATDAIFAPANVVSLQGGFSGESGNTNWTSRRNYLFRDSTGSLFNPFRSYAQLRYFGASRLPAVDAGKLRSAPADYSDRIRETYLQVPDLDPRVATLAKTITERAATPYDKAVAIESFLRSRYAYTLNLTGKPGDDPLARFLFETRAGHCEYFASAMAIMLRTLGIPSREVNGFLPGEFNDLGGDYIVRASDAHSWVEVYFPGSGWATFDPTPAAPQDFGLLSRVGRYIDWLELSWNEWIINYDFLHQLQMAQMLQQNTRNWTETARAWFAKQQQTGRQWLQAWLYRYGVISFAVPVVLTALLITLRYDWLLSLIRRACLRIELRGTGAASASPVLASRFYSELLRMLERHGFPRRASQTPMEFAVAISEPALASAVREFTQLYAHARFGGAPCDASRLRDLLDQITATMRAR